jgi:hypothetical protein
MYGFDEIDEIQMKKNKTYIVSSTLYAKREKHIKNRAREFEERYNSLYEWDFDTLVSLINLPEGQYLVDYEGDEAAYTPMDEVAYTMLEDNFSRVKVKKGLVYR